MGVRKLEELVKECELNGIKLPTANKLSKDAIQVLLRDFYWNRDHKGETMPEQHEVMLAQNIKDIAEKDEERGTHKAEDIWASDQWIAQIKLDGCRLVMDVGNKDHRFYSRNISVANFMYDEKTDNLIFHSSLDMGSANVGTVLDGEVLAPYSVIDTRQFGASKGTITATALQAVGAVINSGPELGIAIQKHYGPVEYHVFDILKFRGEDVRKKTYAERMELLAQVFSAVSPEAQKLIKQVPIVTKDKKAFYESTVKAGGEGIMLKDLKAPYECKRSKHILKSKRYEEIDAFVVGFVPGNMDSGWKDLVGGLIFAVLDGNGKQHIVGCVGSMTLEYRQSITKKVAPYQIANDGEEMVWDGSSKYYASTSPAKARAIDYVLDESVLNKVSVIRGQEWTKNVRLKHCVCSEAYISEGKWLPWRSDKNADQCVMDIESIRKKVLSGERV